MNHSIAYLGLKNNNLGPQGARSIGEALKFNRNVAQLELGFNNLGSEGTRAIEEALEFNGSLVKCPDVSKEVDVCCERNHSTLLRTRQTSLSLLSIRRWRRTLLSDVPKELYH